MTLAESRTILTLSYGAFSCTLEGVEDAVASARALTDHIRAIAAEDPHFGAEPHPLAPLRRPATSQGSPAEVPLRDADQPATADASGPKAAPDTPTPPPDTDTETDTDQNQHRSIAPPPSADIPPKAPATPRRDAATLFRDADNSAQIERILRETDHRLARDEAAQRRSTLLHLRAAVAVKRAQADRSAFGPYRTDPTQNIAASGPKVSPQTDTLRLSQTQRIDTPHDSAEAFAAYADRHGAASPSDLIEAAAAYLTLVIGGAQLSSAQLMALARTVRSDVTRHACITALGHLLYEGKLSRLPSGQFVATERIGFRPGAAARDSPPNRTTG